MSQKKLAIFRRRVFTALSVVSLLLCVATLVFWVRSYWRRDGVHHAYGYMDTDLRETVRCSHVQSTRGSIVCIVTREPPSRPRQSTFAYFDTIARDLWDDARQYSRWIDASSTSILGFGSVANGYANRAFWFPHWFLALLFAILPALYLGAAIRSRRRHRAGYCPKCGYDLRATPDRCPECGTERVSATDEHRWGSRSSGR